MKKLIEKVQNAKIEEDEKDEILGAIDDIVYYSTISVIDDWILVSLSEILSIRKDRLEAHILKKANKK